MAFFSPNEVQNEHTRTAELTVFGPWTIKNIWFMSVNKLILGP